MNILTIVVMATAAFAFACLLRAAGAAEQMLHRPQRGAPYSLFSLTDARLSEEARKAKAHELEALPVCLRDPFTAAFLEHFQGQVGEPTSLAVLETVAAQQAGGGGPPTFPPVLGGAVPPQGDGRGGSPRG